MGGFLVSDLNVHLCVTSLFILTGWDGGGRVVKRLRVCLRAGG